MPTCYRLAQWRGKKSVILV
uniref:Uncharacterized protein n=1 Tax=Anguilla anguilla TaxID=7936 RepID=A0A0E9QXN5_ANGAN